MASTTEALISSEKQFKFLFDYSSDEIFLADLEGHFIEINKRACESLGYARDELITMKFTDIKTSKYRHLVAQNIKSLLEHGKLTYESEHLTKTGELLPVEMKSRIITYNNQKVIISVSRNIAKRKAMEQKMLSMMIETEQKERKRFAAYEKMIDRSLTRIESMRGLIMDMLDFTRIESGKKNRSIVNLDVIEIAKLAIDSIYPVAIQMNVEIIPDFPEKLIMKGDGSELEIIFNNLLSNAVKYNKENGIVKFTICKENKSVIFTVEDTGIGMSEKEQALLFKEFTRIKTRKTKNISGSGLGLSIMKKIIDLNSGSIHVKSEADIGSKFTVELPLHTNS